MKLKHKNFLFLVAIITNFTLLSGCFTEEDDSSSSGGSSSSSSSSSSSTAPSTSIGGTCTLSSGKYYCANGTGTIIFTATAGDTIYYASKIGSTASVNTGSSSGTSPASVVFTGSDRESLYVSYFATNSSGTETAKEAILYFYETTKPTSSIASARLTSDASNDCILLGDTYTCDGPATITFSADEPSTICVDTEVGTSPNITSATSCPAGSTTLLNNAWTTTISADDTYLQFYAFDENEYTVANEESTTHQFIFEINNTHFSNISCGGLTTMTGGGYCNSNVTFELERSNDVSSDSDYNLYQLWYREISGSDVSGDTSSDTVFINTPPVPHSDSVKYYSNYPDGTSTSNVVVSKGFDQTKISQYNANILYSGTYAAGTEYITNASTDTDGSIVFYIDTDKPTLSAIPPSSGTLDASMKMTPFIYDKGNNKIYRYAESNATLTQSAPTRSLTAKYCQLTEAATKSYGNHLTLVPSLSSFWTDCGNARNNYTNDTQLTIAANSYVSFYGEDPASNKSDCDSEKQYTCIEDYYDSDLSHVVEYYTPGILKTGFFHDLENQDEALHTNFGYATITTDLDGDGYDNDIIIGAPAYAYTDTTDSTTDRGAVYIWYDEFRERAQIRLGLGDATMDISGSSSSEKTLTFSTDGGSSTSVTLDPSNDTLGIALATDYSDKTAATAYEIAQVLNRAFLNSFGTEGNYLFAMATDASGDLLTSTDTSSDGYITIGHLNRSISGYFSMTSNGGFDASSDFNFTSQTVRAYDYAFFGETDGNEFGYAIVADAIDASPDANYSSKQLLVGAPGYSSNAGAVYVLRLPASDASADYGHVELANDLVGKGAHRILDTTSDERFGSTIVAFDRDGDSTSDLFIGAPYADGDGSSDSYRGVVYFIADRDYDFDSTADTTSDISGVTDLISGSVDNGLFGSSLVIGKTRLYVDAGNTNHLYVGAPGQRYGSVEGYVEAYGVTSGSLLSSQDQSVSSTLQEYNSVGGNLFGYSLGIVGSSFDTSTPSNCPCLLIGAPSSRGMDVGKVWIYKDFFRTFIEGTTSNELFGSSIYVGKIGKADTADSVVIGSRFDQYGKITILRPQAVTHGEINAGMTAKTLTYSPKGILSGENLGHSIAILQYDSAGSKALVIGAPGEHQPGSWLYNRPGIDNDRKGGVQIITQTKLGF